jgi:hypothetical protein
MQTTTVVIPEYVKMNEDESPPRPSGACWLRPNESQDEFMDRFMDRNHKFCALSSFERLAYEMGILRDVKLDGHAVEWKVIKAHNQSPPGSLEKKAYDDWIIHR